MRSTIPLTQDDLTRQERLAIWLRRKGVSQAAIARTIGVKPMAVKRWFDAERLPSWRVRQLLEFGIPEALLPRAEDVASGPRNSRQSVDKATPTA